jgi:hypothetical protein
VTNATYKLAKQLGGVGHYAEVSVQVSSAEGASFVEVRASAFEWLKEAYGPDAWEWAICDDWRTSAVSGCEDALNNVKGQGTNSPVRVVVTRIHAHPAHSCPQDVRLAACGAVWKALGVDGAQLPDWDSGRAN